MIHLSLLFSTYDTNLTWHNLLSPLILSHQNLSFKIHLPKIYIQSYITHVCNKSLDRLRVFISWNQDDSFGANNIPLFYDYKPLRQIYKLKYVWMKDIRVFWLMNCFHVRLEMIWCTSLSRTSYPSPYLVGSSLSVYQWLHLIWSKHIMILVKQICYYCPIFHQKRLIP